MADQRIRFRDIKPYYAPSSLDDLHGPYNGKVQLRHEVRWVPGARVSDIGNTGERRTAYQALLEEGKPTDQTEGLNKHRLIEEWPHLHLDQRIRDLWESRFPELRFA